MCRYWMLTSHSAWITTVGFSLAKQPFLLSVCVVWVAVTAQIQLNQTIPRLQSQELSSGSVVLFEKLTVRLRTIVGIIRKKSSLPARCGAVDMKRVAVGATGWMGAVRERCQHWGTSSLEMERDKGLVIPFDHLDPAIPEGSPLKFSICGLLSLTYKLMGHNERRTGTV